jgi:ABC-2 type transport system ATP-binding protein
MPMEPAVLRGVVKHYGAKPAVSGLDFTLEPGQVTVLLGPNGAGKSTTLTMIAGLRRPTHGSVRVFGADPCDWRARRRMGVMLQESGIPGTLTVGELIELFASLYPAPLPAARVAAAAGLTDKLAARAGSLSGGQRQRLYFALATCGDPDLLLLDEPTVAMDTEARAASLAHLRELAAAGKAVLLTTHYLREAEQVADRVLVIADGTLVVDGSIREIMVLAASRQVRFQVAGELGPDDLAGLPVIDLEIRRVPGPASLVTFRSDRPEDVLTALILRGVRISDLEVTGADLEQAVGTLLRRAENRPPTADRSTERSADPSVVRAADRTAVLAHSADPADRDERKET